MSSRSTPLALSAPVLSALLVLVGCGGGTGGGASLSTATAQISPASETASAPLAASAAAASEPASAPAQATAASEQTPAFQPASPSTRSTQVTQTTQVKQSEGTIAGATGPNNASAGTASGNSSTVAMPANSGPTVRPAAATLLVAAPATGMSAPSATRAMTTQVAAPAYAGPARYSPLWGAANTSSPKVSGLSGMSLLMSVQAGLTTGVRTAREDWPALVARYKADSGVASWVKNELARVDAWIARNFERADLIGGWTLDYIDPTTKLALTWKPTDPEPPAGTTDAERKFKAAWVAKGRDYNIEQMRAAARIYSVTGLRSYAEWAAKQLDFYAAQYAKWPLSTAEGRSTMYRQGLDEAVAAFPLVDTARLLDAYAGTTRAAAWRNQLFLPMASNLKSTSAPKSNIQLWHASAIAAIAMRYRDAALLDYAINDPAGIKANMAVGLTTDNLWVEGTFSYNTYVIECLSKLLVASGVEGYAGSFTNEANAALRMLLAPLEYRFDDGSLPNPGDSTSAQTVINELAHWYLFRVSPTYWGVAKATAWRTWESLLDPPTPNSSSTAPSIPTASTHNFDTLRWAVLRAGIWQAFVRYGGMKANHWADEVFNVELRHGTTTIAKDPGTTSYGSPYHAGYFQRGAAANAPLVDGENQGKWAPGTLTGFDADAASLAAEQTAFQADASVSRAFRLTAGGLVEQTSLKAPSGAKRRLGLAFSSPCDMVPGAGVAAATGLPALPPSSAFGYWTGIATFTAGTSWQLTLKCAGGKNYLLTVWGPSGQRLYIGKAPDTPMPATRNSLYYEVSAASAVFESSITAQ